MRRWRRAIAAGCAGLVVAAGAGIYYARKARAAGDLVTAPARRGEFLVIVRCRGELQARRSLQITAPTDVPELRIVWLAPPTSKVTQGETVIRFDPSSAKQQLQEKEAALKQAQASLEQAEAEARITAEQDNRDLLAARYEVEKARLEVSKKEIVSVVEAENAKILLELAEKKYDVQEATGALHEASGKAKIASLTRARDHAQSEVDLVKHRLEEMEVKAPITGIIVYLPNYAQGWMNAKPFKVGDQAWPGMALAEVPDLDTLEMEGKIEEIDRARAAPGNDARVRVDSLPELTIPAALEQISPLTQLSFEWPPVATFRGYARLKQTDPRLRPGMNGSMDIVVERLPDAISIPAKALFTRRGQPVVYIANGGMYRLAQVKVLARNPDEIAVSGIAEGAMVTMSEPDMAAEGQS
ncbi:MAG: HlyD family efflux transporter periplasmic adaptor subunit [Bryobacteraceae bacterium]|nr:HlyD family efflux transporter periplasmic adaptor subunit [Bryobacteraceae bacterium]